MKFTIDTPATGKIPWIARLEGPGRFAEFLLKQRDLCAEDRWIFRTQTDGIYRTSEKETFVLVRNQKYSTTEIPHIREIMRENDLDFEDAKWVVWDFARDIFLREGGDLWWETAESCAKFAASDDDL